MSNEKLSNEAQKIKNMKIKAKWGISYSEGVATFDLSDVNCETEQEWNELSESEKEERLQLAIDELPESPSMILEKYEVQSKGCC